MSTGLCSRCKTFACLALNSSQSFFSTHTQTSRACGILHWRQKKLHTQRMHWSYFFSTVQYIDFTWCDLNERILKTHVCIRYNHSHSHTFKLTRPTGWDGSVWAWITAEAEVRPGKEVKEEEVRNSLDVVNEKKVELKKAKRKKKQYFFLTHQK